MSRELGLLALVAALLGTGCGRAPSPTTAPPAEQRPVLLEPTERSLDRGPYLATQPRIKPQPREVAEAVAAVEWTATPGPANCPDSPVTGRLNGRDFLCRYASLTPDDEDELPTWSLRLSNQPRGEYCGTGLDDDAVFVEWHLPVGAVEWHKELDAPRPAGAAAWFVIEQPDGWPHTSALDWAAWVRIDALRGSTEPGGAPSVTGRVVVMFSDKHRSWIAGTFTADGCRR